MSSASGPPVHIFDLSVRVVDLCICAMRRGELAVRELVDAALPTRRRLRAAMQENAELQLELHVERLRTEECLADVAVEIGALRSLVHVALAYPEEPAELIDDGGRVVFIGGLGPMLYLGTPARDNRADCYLIARHLEENPGAQPGLIAIELDLRKRHVVSILAELERAGVVSRAEGDDFNGAYYLTYQGIPEPWAAPA